MDHHLDSPIQKPVHTEILCKQLKNSTTICKVHLTKFWYWGTDTWCDFSLACNMKSLLFHFTNWRQDTQSSHLEWASIETTSSHPGHPDQPGHLLFRSSGSKGSHFVQSSGSPFVQVIQVRPALKITWVWPGLDHVWNEIKEYMIWRCNHAKVLSLLATPTFAIVLWCLLVHRSPTPVLYAHVCTKSDHVQACIEPRPSINCYCRLQEC